MTIPAQHRRYSIQDYYRIENDAADKHEFRDGEILAMSGGTPSAMDRVLATQFGYHALELVMSAESGKLVVLKDGRIGHVSIQDVAGKQRKVPAEHPLVHTANAVATNFGD
jgi:hypothetical protein